MRRGALRLMLVALAAAPLAMAAPAHAQAAPSEDAVKAAFLPKFARYVEFPEPARPNPGQPFYLCLIGRDPFGGLVDRAAASEVVDGHPVAVRRFASTDPDAVAGCHIALLTGTARQQTAEMIAALRRQAIVTITDSRAGRTRGMIHFTLVDGRVRFFIDDATAAEHGIGISSRLLALAVEVRQRVP